MDFQQALQTIGAAVGSQYVNDFTLSGRSYKVFLQADGDYRNSPDDLEKLYVRSRSGQMVSFGELANITPVTGPEIIFHYNSYRSIKLQANPAEGYSSGQAIAGIDEAVAETALPSISGDWYCVRQRRNCCGKFGVTYSIYLRHYYGVSDPLGTVRELYESHYYLVDCAAGNLGCFIFYCLARTKQRCIRSGSTGNADWSCE